jgi:hypothetical protein
MRTLAAQEHPVLIDDLVAAAFDVDGLSVEERIGDGFAPALQNSSESCPGNSHLTAGLFVRHIQKIGKPDCLAFIDRQADLFQFVEGDSARFEIADLRINGYDSIFLWSQDDPPLMSIYSLLDVSLDSLRALVKIFFDR